MILMRLDAETINHKFYIASQDFASGTETIMGMIDGKQKFTNRFRKCKTWREPSCSFKLPPDPNRQVTTPHASAPPKSDS